MSTIKIYLHEENKKESRYLTVNSDTTIADLLKIALPEHNGESENFQVFIEDEETPKNKGDHLAHIGVKDKSHIHCHRCKKIKVSVSYNGQSFEHAVEPSLTAKRIKKKAGEKFGISVSDLADLVLQLPDESVLQDHDHIGSFVSFPECKIHLNLIPQNLIQG